MKNKLPLKRYYDADMKALLSATVSEKRQRFGNIYILLKDVFINARTQVDHLWVKQESRMEKLPMKIGSKIRSRVTVGTYPSESNETKYNVSAFRHIVNV